MLSKPEFQAKEMVAQCEKVMALAIELVLRVRPCKGNVWACDADAGKEVRS
ncbi:hypothetical protein [Oryzomonas japonica]|uniref:hypothetical protein n=1 Tax=Oryzomonas japonica TaxID=2603858 RepID=UPI0017841FB3|nr:hypothetical protein [Oryzomonas japonica]